MEDRNKYRAGQYSYFAPDSYLERTSRSVYAIVFLLPFIIFYECGVLFIKTDILNQSVVLVDAFVWLKKSVGYIGFEDKMAWIAPPLVVLVILVALQITSRKSWSIWPQDLWIMAIECVLLAIPLIVFSLFLNASGSRQSSYLPHQQSVKYAAVTDAGSAGAANSLVYCQSSSGDTAGRQSTFTRMVTGIGAGIYEELVFRLILICVLMMILQDVLRFDHTMAIIMAVLVSAALFSAHHHIDFLSGQVNTNDPFNLIKFVFRTIAGVYFAILFAIRGFGVTAGTHACYDILAVLINHLFFAD